MPKSTQIIAGARMIWRNKNIAWMHIGVKKAITKDLCEEKYVRHAARAFLIEYLFLSV